MQSYINDYYLLLSSTNKFVNCRGVIYYPLRASQMYNPPPTQEEYSLSFSLKKKKKNDFFFFPCLVSKQIRLNLFPSELYFGKTVVSEDYINLCTVLVALKDDCIVKFVKILWTDLSILFFCLSINEKGKTYSLFYYILSHYFFLICQS